MKLKPCPFCGESKQLFWKTPAWVQCGVCLCEGPRVDLSPIEAWNRRAKSDDIVVKTDQKSASALPNLYGGKVAEIPIDNIVNTLEEFEKNEGL
jgi:hypothetical protein